MSLSVKVWTFPDEILASCVHPDIKRLVEFARAAGLQFLGNVDPYDETRFNRMQVEIIMPELKFVLDSTSGGVADAARELISMGDLVDRKPHRYLVFIGD
jgi:hypothetical protein